MSGLVGKSLDHYNLIDQIGQGGMATVFRAEDTRNGQVVALKVLSPTISSDRRFVLRFRREGGLLTRLRHPNVIPVTEYGQDEGMVYLAMPFIDGETLYDLYRRGGLTPQQAARWMSQVAEALQFAHDQGVIHRDVKPSNVIIDKQGTAHLGDFGLARMVEGSNSLTGSMLMGTPAYMSPEQARGEKLDPRADQYAFGVILYQLFTGRLPFDGETPMQTAMMHLNDAPPSLRSINAELAPALEKVILTALAKDRRARFPSMRALNTAFQAAVRGDPLDWLQPTVVIDSAIARPSKPVPQLEPRRRPLWPVLIGLLAVLGLASLALPQVRAAIGLGAAAEPAPTEAIPLAAFAPTASSPPATELPTPTVAAPVGSEICPNLRLIGFNTSGNTASWSVDNGTTQPVILEDMLDLQAPAGNQAVQSIYLGDGMIFEGPAVAGEFTWIDGVSRVVQAGEVRPLTIGFAWEADPTGYGLELVFSGGCIIRGNW